MASFEASVTIDCSHEAAFEFLIRPENVAEISPPDMGLRLLDVPEVLQLGSRIEFEMGGVGPVPVQRVVHEVTAFKRPQTFTETQLEGPLKLYVHEHVFEANGSDVVVIDRVEFEPPGGLAGFLVTAEVILKSLASGFEHRHQELKRRLEQPRR